MDGRGGGGASHGTAAELEAAQGGVERSRFSPGRIAEFKQLAADPDVYSKVRKAKSEERRAKSEKKKQASTHARVCFALYLASVRFFVQVFSRQHEGRRTT